MVKNYYGVILDLIFTSLPDTVVHTVPQLMKSFPMIRTIHLYLFPWTLSLIMYSWTSLQATTSKSVTWILCLIGFKNCPNFFFWGGRPFHNVFWEPCSCYKAQFSHKVSEENYLFSQVVQCWSETTCYFEENYRKRFKETGEAYFYDKFSRLRSQCKKEASKWMLPQLHQLHWIRYIQ